MDYIKQTINVTKLLMMEAGTHSQQYRRPYEMEASTNTLKTLQSRIQESSMITPTLIGNVLGSAAGAFIMPSAAPECAVQPVEGWNSKRFLFTMEVECSNYMGGKSRQMISGWTEHLGVSLQGSLDEDMIFHIDKVIHLRVMHQNIPGHGVIERVNTHDCSHVLVNPVQNSSSIYTNNPTFLTRPEDIYKTVSSSLIQDAGDVFDSRIMMTQRPQLSKMSNGLASNYVADVLKSYQLANNSLSDFGQDNKEMYQAAQDFCVEASISDDVFLSAIARLKGDFNSSTFTMKDLKTIDPSIVTSGAVKFQLVGPAYQVHHAGDSQEWGGKDIHTQAATIIGQGVVSIMMTLGLVEIGFVSENMYRPDCSPLTIVSNYETFSNGDMTGSIQSFANLFERTIMNSLTFNNNIPYTVRVHADVHGDTRINISLDSNPPEEFVVPSFCDALMVPIATNTVQRKDSMAREFETLMSYVTDTPLGANNSMPLAAEGFNKQRQKQPMFDTGNGIYPVNNFDPLASLGTTRI